ncbi:hypothetical protein ACFLTE_10685 [Bacteroidota bacterium]
MNTSIEYSEINTPKEFNECVILQKEIFGLSDIDVIPAMFLNMVARKNPFMGIIVGIFKNIGATQKMIGFSINVSTGIDNSLYGVATGMLSEYQNKMYGYYVILKVREIAIENNVKIIYVLYDPLEANLGRLYMQKFGFIGTKFIENAYQLNDDKDTTGVPNDKIFVEWDPISNITCKKIEGKYECLSLKEALDKYPVVDNIDYINDSPILVHIPENFKEIKQANPKLAKEYRNKVRPIFDTYINKKGFKLTESFTGKINRKRMTYYLLEK